MKKILVYLIASLFIISVSSVLLALQEKDYEKQWSQVIKFEKDGLPKSALIVVSQIYQQAKSSGNNPQVLKALIYRASLQSQFEEDNLLKTILEFEEELLTAHSPKKQILHSLTAELYQWYFNNKRWKIMNRGTVIDYENNNINTWDAQKFGHVIRDHYLASISERNTLERIKLNDYSAILSNNGKSSFMLWPTLYDLLANRVIQYYSSPDANLVFVSTTTLTNPALFENAKKFVNLDLKIDSTSIQYQILGLYQHLLNFHLTKSNTTALVDLDLKRFQYVFDHSVHTQKLDELYIKSLENLLSQKKENEISVRIAAQLANRYMLIAGNYQPLEGDQFRYKKVTALNICEAAIEQYPDSKESFLCKNIMNEIKGKHFAFQLNAAEIPQSPYLAQLSFKNTTKLFFKAVKMDPQKNLLTFYTNKRDEMYSKVNLPATKSWSQDLPDTKDFQTHTTELIMPALEKGYYLVFASNDSTFNNKEDVIYQSLLVTSLSVISNNDTGDGSLNLFVLDRETGNHIEGVEVTAYELGWNSAKRNNDLRNLGSFYSNQEGFVKLALAEQVKNGSLVYTLKKEDDFLPSPGRSSLYKSAKKIKARTKTHFFTDRAIYRPGQTVYFKGIVIDRSGDEVAIKPNFKSEVTFYNSNRKKVKILSLVTNDFGSFQGAFVIPTGGLNGSMRIKNKTGSISFSVEEYKRPTFEITFDTIKEKYKLGDEITVTGMTENFAGSKLQNAEVKYRVVQTPIVIPYFRFYYPYPVAKEIEIANGTIKTNSEGQFSIQFPTEDGDAINEKPFPQRFSIYADVLDITGEVQSATTHVTIGKEALILAILSDEEIQKEQNKGIEISATNLSGASVSANVEVKLYKLTPPDRVFVNRYWNQIDIGLIPEDSFRADFPHAVYKNESDKQNWERQEVFSTNKIIKGKTTILDNEISNSESGIYMVEATSISENKDTTATKKFFTLYSTTGKQLPGKQLNWSVVSKNKAEPGETIQLLIGSAAKKSKLYYEIVNGNELIDSQWITLSRTQKVIDIPVLEAYRGNFEIRTMMVRYNRVFIENHTIEVPFTNKKLDITIETHRDFLTPGQVEEWLVKVSGPKGEILAAELMAGMYDASLDKFKSNSWDLNLYHSKRQANGWKNNYFRTMYSQNLSHKPIDLVSVKPILYPEINWFGFRQFGYRNDLMLRGSAASQTYENDEVLDIEDQGNQKRSGEAEADQDKLPDDISTPMLEEEDVAIPLRTNFNETAFFYPQLQTDSLGNTVFTFTTPDALTEWKLMMLANSKDLKTGSMVQKFKAHKDLMIIPNLPRFVRQGDQLVFSAKVINFTDKPLPGKADIEFFDAITMKTIQIFSEGQKAEKSLNIKPGQSQLIDWAITIPDDYSMIGYRVKASTEGFTDGEERLIPVLTNRMLVTETMPMPIKGKQTKTFTFDKLVDSKTNATSTQSNYNFTLEFTSNPAWYAIQALPYLDEPTTENPGNYFKQYFVNALSGYIINSDPKIKNVIESWKQISPDAFYSNLQKNEELKSLVLNATPWVLEAEDEAEQKRRIAILFDVNRMDNEKSNVFLKLKQSQLSSGAWSWFKGMKEDRHTTQHIVLGFAKLNDKGIINLADDVNIKKMLVKALGYLDNEIKKDFEKLKIHRPNYLTENQLSSSQIEYLYARILLAETKPVPQKTLEAYNYYLGQAKKFWLKKSNYLQGMIAITLNRSGSRNEAEGVIRSLKERSLFTDEMGMYWRTERGWYWYQAPIESQAMMIEAFDQVLNDQKSIEQMKIWLLKQKQTTNWKTKTATAEAVYALLLTGNNLITDDQLVTIKVGGEPLNPKSIDNVQIEPGTGYFKTSWSASEIKPDLGKIEVHNPNTGIAWGAAYWQYFEDLDQITEHDSPLSIEKVMFIEELTDEGPVIRPLDEKKALKTGNKVVVRLIVRTDRDMDYVHIKDMRATALEPVNAISGYTYQGGLGFYKSVTDVSTEFFIRSLNKGTFVLEYPLAVTQKGEFSNGIATIQSYYAPEFAAHSEGLRLVVK